MKKLVSLVLLGIAAMALIPMAIARPGYRTAVVAQYSLVPTTACTYCHVNAGGGPSWNAFGNELKANFKGNIGEALFETLKAMKDSDGDGYADALEAFAGTLPGDKDSKPNVTPESLMANFTKAGGVDIYKPK